MSSTETTSLLAQHLSPAIREALKDKVSAHGATLDTLSLSGTHHPDSAIGVYAADADSYNTFADLLDPIIEAYHGLKLDTAPPQDFSPLPPSACFNDDRIVSTRIRVARNLANSPFGSIQTVEDRIEVCRAVEAALASIPAPHSGSFRFLEDIPEDEQAEMREAHRLFQQGDRFLEVAGLNRDWPRGRAVFESEDGVGMVWVGEEDHLRIIALQAGGDLPAVFARLAALATRLDAELPFARDERRGHLTSCPTNVGTGMRASVHVKLAGLGRDPDALRARAKELKLQIRGTHGEHTDSVGGVFDVSNLQRLGLSEREALSVLAEGLRVLLDADTAALQA